MRLGKWKKEGVTANEVQGHFVNQRLVEDSRCLQKEVGLCAVLVWWAGEKKVQNDSCFGLRCDYRTYDGV